MISWRRRTCDRINLESQGKVHVPNSRKSISPQGASACCLCMAIEPAVGKCVAEPHISDAVASHKIDAAASTVGEATFIENVAE